MNPEFIHACLSGSLLADRSAFQAWRCQSCIFSSVPTASGSCAEKAENLSAKSQPTMHVSELEQHVERKEQVSKHLRGLGGRALSPLDPSRNHGRCWRG